VSDINEQRRADARTLGARWRDPIGILTADLDILVPAAVGDVLTRTAAPRLRCRLIVGPANNQLATDDVADLLDSRDIVWVPDILASAGGIVHAINIEQHGMTEEQVAPQITAIGGTVARVLAQARKSSLTPLTVARHQSRERIRRGKPT
jgi:leucine dehydrogenase